MNCATMSILLVSRFGMRASAAWRTNSTLVGSSNRPLASSRAMSMSMPVRLPLSSSKCHGGLVVPVPTTNLPRLSTSWSLLAPVACACAGWASASPAAAATAATPTPRPNMARRAGSATSSCCMTVVSPVVAGRIWARRRPACHKRSRCQAHSGSSCRQRPLDDSASVAICLLCSPRPRVTCSVEPPLSVPCWRRSGHVQLRRPAHRQDLRWMAFIPARAR